MIGGICNICGRAGRMNTCRLCGKQVCQAHMVQSMGTCVQCSRGKSVKDLV